MTKSHPTSDILIFVEDPGAANFIADLPRALSERGWRVKLATSGSATRYLEQRGVTSEILSPDADLEAFITLPAPRLLAIGTAENPDSPGLALTSIARRRRIPSIGLIDASVNLAFRFRGRSQNPLEFCPDAVVVPDLVGRHELMKLGIDEARIFVTGHPHWDHVRKTAQSLLQENRIERRQRLFPGSTPDQMLVVFIAEISGGLDPNQFKTSAAYTLTGNGTSTGRTEIVIEELLLALQPSRDRLHLVLRLHPKQSAGDLAAYRDDFDSVSQGGSSLEVLYAADAVIGMTSAALIEAALLCRPTLSIVPDAREALWLPTIAAGMTKCAWTRPAVAREISALLNDPSPPTAEQLDRTFPPGATGRVLTTLEQYLKN